MTQGLLHVEHFSLSEYANSDDSGRFLIAGMFGETVLFSQRPAHWPRIHMLLLLKPLVPNVAFDIVFYNPANEEFLRFGGSYANENQPDVRERLAFVQDLPAMLSFEGEGVYAVQLEIKGKSIFRKEYSVEIGEPKNINFGQIDFGIKTSLAQIIEKSNINQISASLASKSPMPDPRP